MRTIKLTTGVEVPLDGDLLTVLEALYREMTARRELERTFEDTVREIQEVIDQMTDEERLAEGISVLPGSLAEALDEMERSELVAEALGEARRQFEGRPRGESLAEDLFALIAAELRGLRPHRGYLRPVLETALSPLARAEASPDGEAIRVEHMEAVGRLIAARVPGESLSPVAWNLYWTLYTGVLAFWTCDPSPHQEDTLAVLDHYLKAFVASLPRPSDPATEAFR